MIVVIGDPVLEVSSAGGARAGGPAAVIGRACVLAGATVQLAGKVGDDPAGDEVLLALTRDRIGHVAILRDAGAVTTVLAAPSLPDDEEVTIAAIGEADDADDTEDARPAVDPGMAPERAPSSLGAEDLDLALRYLTSFAVLVVGQPVAARTLAVAVESAAYAGAHLILIDPTGDIPAVPADDLTVLASPPTDPEGDFAGLVARYAAALDAGRPASAAFRAALGAMGSESTVG